MFWIFTVILLFAAALFVLVPLWRRPQTPGGDNRVRANVALFHERRRELETELAGGRLEQEQFEQLLLELQRNLLGDVPDNTEQVAGGHMETGAAARPWLLNHAVPLLLVLLLPVAAYSLYAHWGYARDVVMMDLFQRTVDNRGDPEQTRDLIVSLGQAARENEEQPWTWYFLAENFATIGMFNEAEIGYGRSAELLEESSPEQAMVLGRLATVMYINAGLELTPALLEVIERARRINPNETSSLQLLAADAQAREDYEAAIGYWRLLIQADPNSREAERLRAGIAAAQQLLQEPGAGPVIDVHVSLAEGLALDESLRVFIAARNAGREGLPPLAAVSLTVGELPATVRLDNSSAVGPFNLSSAENVFVSALVSQGGTANPQPGDYRVVSENFALDNAHTEITLLVSEQLE